MDTVTSNLYDLRHIAAGPPPHRDQSRSPDTARRSFHEDRDQSRRRRFRRRLPAAGRRGPAW
ncbi:hypothetical protein HBB16_18355 [Pseudonocardia sp. MCCB 268]|nr:hypothetical protein [Pseudonocardia cytotoxica]